MVFFTCDGCGDVLKKNQVDAHAQRCRKCVSVSCVDCHVSFFGDDYRKHTSCMTEAERYEKTGPNVQKKKQKQKKASPQEVWMDIVQASANDAAAPSHLKRHLEAIAELDNVPRKPKQFQNFAANSLELRGKNGSATVNEIWEYLKIKREERMEQHARAEAEEEKAEKMGAEETAPTGSNNDDNDKSNEGADNNNNEDTKLQSTQSDNAPMEEEEEEESTDTNAPVEEQEAAQKNQAAKNAKRKVRVNQVRKAMRKVLRKSQGKSLHMKYLKKQVLARLEVPDTEKKGLKRIVRRVAHKGKRFLMNGKMVTLKVTE